ncbi:MAG: phosphonate C-P lyase system protein PhnH [bacterium]|nr:phosphonate C-P lyase system protein PhnH [bacterium]
MTNAAAYPPYTPAEARARETFLALMWSFSYPGRVYSLPDGKTAVESIAETLLDLETSFYTPDSALEPALSRHSARSLPPQTAAYHFYPHLRTADMETVESASIGTLLYPDRAATLFIGCTLDAGETLTLSGPGVNGSLSVHVSGLPDEFWALREKRRRYPLGWDMYLIDDLRVIGLPRSVQIVR